MIQRVHLKDNLLKDNREVNWTGLDALGQLSGNRYCHVDSVIEGESH